MDSKSNPSSSQFSNLNLSSPYLNYDPNLIAAGYNSSEYIFPDGGSRPSRGRFDLACGQIGASLFSGAALGGVRGCITGYKNTLPSLVAANVEQVSWSVRRSQILNYITKAGANTANTFGVVALLYVGIGVGLAQYGNDSNDDLNTVIAATTTGMLYRGLGTPKTKPNEAATILKTMSQRQIRLRRSLVGGAIGFGVSLLYVLATNSEKYWK